MPPQVRAANWEESGALWEWLMPTPGAPPERAVWGCSWTLR